MSKWAIGGLVLALTICNQVLGQADKIIVTTTGVVNAGTRHVFAGYQGHFLVDGESTPFYQISIVETAISGTPTITIKPETYSMGITNLYVTITDQVGSNVNSITNLSLTANFAPVEGPAYFRQIRAITQWPTSRPVAIGLSNIGAIGQISSTSPAVVTPAVISVAQINAIQTFRNHNYYLTGDVFLDATTTGGTYWGGSVAAIVDAVSVGGRLWGRIQSAGAVLSINVAGQIGFSPSDDVSVSDRTFRLFAPSLRTMAGERIYLTMGSSSQRVSASLIQTTGNPTVGNPDAGGMFGNAWITSLDAGGSVTYPSIIVNGDLGGSIDFSSAIPVNNASNPAVAIGRTLRSTGSVSLPSNGLVGQVVINKSTGAGQWLGAVNINSVPILQDSPGDGAYSYMSSDLGGGAVGLVPFKLYIADSTFATYNALETNFGLFLDSDLKNEATTNPLKIAFFGPVRPSMTVTPPAPVQPFTVTVAPPNSPLSIDVSSKFKIIPDVANPRKVKLVAVNPADNFISATYTVTNNATGQRMICDLAGANPPNVEMGDGYRFDLGRDCNGNGQLDAIELALDPGLDVDPHDGYIDTCPTNGTFCVADMNDDMVVDDTDFELFVVAYNTLETIDGDFNGDWLTDDADFQIFQLFYDKLDCLEPWGD